MTIFDSPTLTIHLDRIVENYQLLSSRFAGDECAAVVKADAYGLGAQTITRTLADHGCNTFFVATLEEGIALRAIVPNRRIAVFNGVDEGEAFAFLNHQLIPVLNSPRHIERWREAAANHPNKAPSILHVDTGMARLGLTQSEWETLAEAPDTLEACQISLLMSHLACASDPAHPLNAQQLALFQQAHTRFPSLPCSLTNSSGIFLDPAYHYHLARPGCSLYGITPDVSQPNPMHNVVTLSAPILQIRTLERDQSIGYGATCTRPKGTRLATVAIGYADGIFRSLGNRLHGFFGEHQVPLLGRVSMDLLVFDISTIPEGQLSDASRITLIDDRQPVDHIAQLTETIGYEIFTRLGGGASSRIRRIYEKDNR